MRDADSIFAASLDDRPLSVALQEAATLVRRRLALRVAARAACAVMIVAGVHGALGGSFSTAGVLLLVALPVAAYCAAWSAARVSEGEGGIALAQALDSHLASEDRIPSALDEKISSSEGALAAAVVAEARRLSGQLRQAAAEIAPMPFRDLAWMPVCAIVMLAGFWLAPAPAAGSQPDEAFRGDPLPEDVLRELADLITEARTETGDDPDEKDPLEELAKKVADAEMTPAEALAAAAEAIEAVERERIDMQQDAERMDVLAEALEKFEDTRSLARAVMERRMPDARARIREMREEIEKERKMLQSGKDKTDEKTRKRRLQELRERERRLDELEKAMDRRSDRLRKLNRKLETADKVNDRVRYAQRQGERKRYLDWRDDEREGEGKGKGRQGPRRLGDGRGGEGAGKGGDDWGKGTASHEGAPRRNSVRKVLERVAAQEGDGAVTRFFVESDDDGSQSKLDYGKMVAEVRRRALDTIYQEEVPVTFRTYVRDYFDRVEPETPEEN